MKKILIGLAVGLGTVVFIFWQMFTHDRNLKDARQFMHGSVPDREKEKVLRDLEVVASSTEGKAQSLRDAVESQTKEEIVNAFKKAFHVSNVNGSADTSSP